MSGLDSIALAVAHLEEQKERQRHPPPFPQSASPTQPPPLPQRSFHMPSARVVSTDGNVLTRIVNDGINSDVSSSASNTSNNFKYILSDPIAWLHKTQDRPPLKPPTKTIVKVESRDVLCGRGGETNHHLGNIQYRILVKAFQPLYVSAKRREKPMIAQCIVYSVRQVGGRFLKRMNDKEWIDVGNIKAREKTSQALREGAPELRGDRDTLQNKPKQSPQIHHQQPQQQQQTQTVPPLVSYHAPTQITAAEATFLSAFLTPLQQELDRSVFVTPQQMAATSSSSSAVSARKRPAVISDDNSGSESDTTIPSHRGPRLKRFKNRLEEESPLSS